MKLRPLIALLVVFSSISASAGAEIYGRVWVSRGEERTIAAGARVSLTCQGREKEGTTDEHGAYRVVDVEAGKCTVQVHHDGRDSSRIQIYVSDEGTRANLEISPAEGRWFLTRK